jgi:hypothetical protein
MGSIITIRELKTEIKNLHNELQYERIKTKMWRERYEKEVAKNKQLEENLEFRNSFKINVYK